MSGNKEKSRNPQQQFQYNESFEETQTDNGLESVAEGCDFAEGEKNKSPHCEES
ncbi:hypothetical protein [Mesobacillus campisalis]|uniref:hypothetical protein n=1 Tax=Mesobacillus campisalis TaxID=1408103 RepID=UPI000B2D4FE5|nr:hypothetical protein [Mesobacillus campisalis]